MPPDPALPKAASSASEAAGEGGMGKGSGIRSETRRVLPDSSLGEEVVHEQGRLAGRRRALERCRGDPDYYPAAFETRRGCLARERAVGRVELVSPLEQPWGGRGVEVGAEREDEDVALEVARIRLDALRPGSMARMTVWTKRTPGFSMSRYRWKTSSASRRPNMTSSLEKPKTNPSDWSTRVTSPSEPNCSERLAASSNPPKPAPKTEIFFHGQDYRPDRPGSGCEKTPPPPPPFFFFFFFFFLGIRADAVGPRTATAHMSEIRYFQVQLGGRCSAAA